MLKRDHAEAPAGTSSWSGSLQEGQTARLLTGLITGPYLQAREKPGADFHATFRALLSERLAALPYGRCRAP